MICAICNNAALPRLKKGNVQYFQCTNCKTLFSGPLDQDGMVGGGAELERNTQQNHERVTRVEALTKSIKKEHVSVLDFGAGHGLLVNDLKAAGFGTVVGYDPYNEEFLKLPESEKFDVISCVECCEHWSSPYVEVSVIRRALKPGGIIMFETSFVQVAEEEGIELEDFFYIDPRVGHSTIFSYHGLDLLMALNGFIPQTHYNRHVRLYRKYA